MRPGRRADPGHPVPHHDQRLAHLPGGWAEIRASNPCSEYMFLDDTACNLASLNLLKFRDAAMARSTVEDFDPCGAGCGPSCSRFRCLMAQFPSKEIAQTVLCLPHAGARLRQYRRAPHDQRRSPTIQTKAARCAVRSRRCMTGISYATSAEMARRTRRFFRLSIAMATNMLRVIRNHRRAAHGEADGYEGLAMPPVPLDHASLPGDGRSRPKPGGASRGGLGPRRFRARRGAWLSQCAGRR